MTIASDLAAWLKADALYAKATGSAAAAFGDTSEDSTVITPLALAADGQAEANRQAILLRGPMTTDAVTVKGYRSDLIGKTITINGDRLGYEAGAVAFVIATQENDGRGTTTLTVVRSL